MFAYYLHCTKYWTNPKFVESYLLQGKVIEALTAYPDTVVKRLKAMCVQYQRSGIDGTIDSCIPDAAYNHHMHAKMACFGKGEKIMNCERSSKNPIRERKRKRCTQHVECRFRLPASSRNQTSIINASNTTAKWYFWNGSFSNCFVKEVVPKRCKYDSFQNLSCPVISRSKLTCNSNIAVIMPGPVSQYTIKYILKDTQKDDTAAYAAVLETIKKLVVELRKHASDSAEMIRRLLWATFSHNKTNVIGPPLASYITRNCSRFITSHPTAWCPLRDLKKILQKERVTASVIYHADMPFFQCQALHYLCRPASLENCTVFDFYQNYEVVHNTSKRSNSLLAFCNGAYTHPSYRTRSNTFLQGVKRRQEKHLLKLYQYDFPDTATFGGSLMNLGQQTTTEREKYCQLVLFLFSPFCTLDDIKLPHQMHLQLFQQLVLNKTIGKNQLSFLQNLQNAKSNCFQLKSVDDIL